MTLPDQRTRAVIWAQSFLRRLGNAYAEDGVKKIPSSVRKEARAILRHFPFPMELKGKHFCDKVIDEYYAELDRQSEALLKQQKR